MCQLLGMNCNTPTDILFSFTGFCNRGGKTSDHKDGWGVAFFDGKGVRHFVDHESSVSSSVADFCKRVPIKSCNVIAHIRKATQGVKAVENTHPFVRELWGRYWVFAHNGDLKEFSPTLDGHIQPVGDTDSELSFCYILQELWKLFGNTMPHVDQLKEALRRLTIEISAHGTFNMMLSNGSFLFAHCSTKLCYIVRRHPFSHAKLSDDDLSVDFSEVTTPQDRVAVIVTEPLTLDEVWTPFTAGELKLFIDGEPVD